MTNDQLPRTYTLLGADRRQYSSAFPGTLGGHRSQRLYGRLDCVSANRAIARGGYVRDRVFFADEPTAIAAGYRPCHTCLRDAFTAWKTYGIKGDFTDRTPSVTAGLPELPWTEADLGVLADDYRPSIRVHTAGLLDLLAVLEGGPHSHTEVAERLGRAPRELQATFTSRSGSGPAGARRRSRCAAPRTIGPFARSGALPCS
ncbi:hypothetical protein QMK19_08385 [Streptomyces sp. H10-C2]|uniref:hypothetical protein n=1 Tax=unclassified Streptomyces TaxID=2593676 RepID=UPI0024BBC9A1|nr:MULTISPECIES: hypothetical protein [unclassified Streptomyces]MDJ0344812.1 hypothetical protein [Streptomyces sp. PH10-H1]MDJ0369697.1 hypothetical protein [Streptomyces sp. H10-C2]